MVKHEKYIFCCIFLFGQYFAVGGKKNTSKVFHLTTEMITKENKYQNLTEFCFNHKMVTLSYSVKITSSNDYLLLQPWTPKEQDYGLFITAMSVIPVQRKPLVNVSEGQIGPLL